MAAADFSAAFFIFQNRTLVLFLRLCYTERKYRMKWKEKNAMERRISESQTEQMRYIAIDLKSFYASVECI